MNHIIKTTITLTDENIQDIMCSALQGISYWADEMWVEGLNSENLNVDEALQKGKRVRVHDAEGEKSHALTLNKFKNGIALYGKSNFDEWDMYDADSVIQFALFGKQVYA